MTDRPQGIAAWKVLGVLLAGGFLLAGCRGTSAPPAGVQAQPWEGPASVPGAIESPGIAPPELQRVLSKDVQTTGTVISAQPQIGGVSLEQLINQALERNRSMLDVRDRVDSSWYSIAAADAEFELKIVPRGTGGLSGSSGGDTQQTFGTSVALEKKFATGTQVSAGPQVGWTSDVDENYRSGVGGTITQPLLRGLSPEANLNSVKSAEFSWRTSQRALHLSRVDTVLRTTAASYEVVRQRELVRLNEESVERLNLAVQAARAKERLGMREGVDRYRAEIELKQAEESLQAAELALGDALDNLRILIDVPLETPLDVDAPLSYSLLTIPPAAAVDVALDHRVELDQAADTIQETRRAVRVAKHNILPQLDLSLNYLRYDDEESLGEDRNYSEDVWGASVTTSTDLRRTAERAAYAQTQVAVRTAERSEDAQRDEIVRQVRREIRSLERSAKRIDNQTEQIRQAQGQLAVAQAKFKRGLADNFDVIDAESALRRAQTDLISAVIDYIVGTYRLRAAMGTLIPEPELVLPPSKRDGTAHKK